MAQERVVVCAWTGAKQAIETDADLPYGWLEIPSIMIGVGEGESEEVANLHFVNFDALGHWAASRALTGRVQRDRPKQRIWTADKGRAG